MAFYSFFLPRFYLKYSSTLSAQTSACVNVFVFFPEYVSGGCVWCDLGLPQRDCLDTAFSCLTELSGMLRYGGRRSVCVCTCVRAWFCGGVIGRGLWGLNGYAWVRTCIHLVTPLPAIPPFPPCHIESCTVSNTYRQPSKHLTNTLWLWLLAQDFGIYFKVTGLTCTCLV